MKKRHQYISRDLSALRTKISRLMNKKRPEKYCLNKGRSRDREQTENSKYKACNLKLWRSKNKFKDWRLSCANISKTMNGSTRN